MPPEANDTVLIGPFHQVQSPARLLALSDARGHRLLVEAWAPDLVRIRFVPPGSVPTISWALARPRSEWPEDFPVRVEATASGWRLSTPALTAEVASATGALALRAAGGLEPFVQHDPECPFRHDTSTVGLSLRAVLPAGAMCLGLGEKTGWLDRRGRILEMWNTDVLPHLPDTDPLYQSIPFVIVYQEGRAFGLFLHNTHRSRFDLGFTQPERLEAWVGGGELDYFILAGPSLEHVVRGFTDLTGRMPLPPRWALGYQHSRWGLHDADQVRELAAEMRRRRVPCDVIYLDIDYMDGYRVFTWDPARFPDPDALLSDLAAQGYRVVTIVDPGVRIDDEYPVYREGIAKGVMCRKADGRPFEGVVWPGPTVWPDFLRADARRWWGSWIARQLTRRGVAGIWNDMNEPASFRHPLPTGTLDPDVMHGPDEEREDTTERRELLHAEGHNVYGLLMSQSAFESQLAARPDRRPFVLTRAGFAGVQRYAAVWTGDNSSWWEHLTMMGPELINLGLSGVAFAGADVGGFTRHTSGELLARWTWAGAFTPFMRNHSAIETRRQEVWRFGPEIEAICREAIEWRYRLLPYLYTLAWESSSLGTPIMRPLFWDHPGDAAAARVQDQWMLGPHLVVAPITQPAATHRAAYLPAGEWVHLWQPVRILGPAHALVDAPLSHIPVFARAGAVVPLGPVAQHTGELAADARISLYVTAPSPGSAMSCWTWLYEDEGDGFGYRQGRFSRRRFEARWSPGERAADLALALVCSPREGSWSPPRRWLEVVIARAGRPPASVRWAGDAVPPSQGPLRPVTMGPADPAEAASGEWAQAPGWHYDEALDVLVVRFGEAPSESALEVDWRGAP